MNTETQPTEQTQLILDKIEETVGKLIFFIACLALALIVCWTNNEYHWL
jgi:hypothetical protein